MLAAAVVLLCPSNRRKRPVPVVPPVPVPLVSVVPPVPVPLVSVVPPVPVPLVSVVPPVPVPLVSVVPPVPVPLVSVVPPVPVPLVSVVLAVLLASAVAVSGIGLPVQASAQLPAMPASVVITTLMSSRFVTPDRELTMFFMAASYPASYGAPIVKLR